MPNPWKKKSPPSSPGGAVTLARLLSAHGSLVVKPGFPTSIADIVVNNRRRIRKPSRHKKPKPPDLDPDPNPDPPVSDSRPSPRLPPPLPSPRRTDAKYWGIRVLFVTLAVLIALAFERRKLLAGITLFAAGFRFLDLFDVRILQFLKSSSKDRGLDCDLNLDESELVSPIRVIETGEIRSSSEDNNDAERERVGVIPCIEGSKKKKKLFRKFIPKQFRPKKENKAGKTASSVILDSDPRELCNGTKEVVGESIEEEIFDENVGSDHRECAQGCVCEVDSRTYLKLAFFSIILLGLVGGKGLALVLTVSWFLLIKSSRLLWRSKKDCNV